MHLRPDPSTVRIVPWATDPTAQVIHDCYDRDGKLVPYAPRSVLRHICELYAAKGWDPVVAPELEFYLVARNTDPDVPLKPPVGRSGRSRDLAPGLLDRRRQRVRPAVRGRLRLLRAMELNVDTLIHEVGAGQMEINFFHAHPLGLADEVFFFKRTVREAALRHDMFATFMAKPIAGEPGSAMHVHQSVIDKATGRNIFSNEDGTPSQGVLLVHRRPAEVHPGGDGAVRALRQQLPPAGARNSAPDQHPVGHRQPHRGHPQPGGLSGRAAHREPRHRRRRQPLRGAGRHAGLRLPGHQNSIEPAPECKGDAYLGDYQLPRSLGEALALLRAEKDLPRCWARTSSPSTPRSRRSSTPSS
jgi:glutamine synthetase